MSRNEIEKGANAKESDLIDGAIKKMKKLSRLVTVSIKKKELLAVAMIGKNKSESEGILYMTGYAIPLVEKYIRSDEFQSAISDAARAERGEQCDCPKCQMKRIINESEDGSDIFKGRLREALEKMLAEGKPKE